MIINWLIFAAAIIGSGVFATYYGGNISYALFYLSLLIPIIAFLYTLYVYFRFKIHQAIGTHQVIKGEWINYSFVIANEDYITFRNVKVNFLKDKSTIDLANKIMEFSLLPSESERMETRLKCNYRGEYFVGVDSIEVTDFLYLFRITYPILSKLKIVVYPRVVKLDRLGIAPPQSDVKNPTRVSNMAEEELDTEVRKYNIGDSKKRIHWKASARMNELITRKYQHNPKAEIVLFMDLVTIKAEELKVVSTEDKIIESVLAIADFYALRNTPSQVIYDMDGVKQVSIASREDFNAFYKACVRIRFQSEKAISEMIRTRLLYGNGGLFCVVATASLSKELYMATVQAAAGGNHVCVLFVSDDISEKTKILINNMKNSGVNVYQITSEDEIADILSQEIIL
jgi:uncharacterized protein (DUF58 family)